MNKLHVILGFLETGQPEKAKRFILDTSIVSGKKVSEIQNLVPDKTLAALLIGKLIRASELGITLTILPDSHFFGPEDAFPSECYTTIVGNLLENAIYELNRKPHEIKEISLGIYTDPAYVTIICDDTGDGIPDSVLSNIFDPHMTTKGEGHGNGLYLIKEITDRFDGQVSIETEEGEGTSITVTIPL